MDQDSNPHFQGQIPRSINGPDLVLSRQFQSWIRNRKKFQQRKIRRKNCNKKTHLPRPVSLPGAAALNEDLVLNGPLAENRLVEGYPVPT